jgi:hypothetical protein
MENGVDGGEGKRKEKKGVIGILQSYGLWLEIARRVRQDE